MANNLAPDFKKRFFDADGNPLALGKLYTYQATTLTPQVTYQDSTTGAPNANPIILDADGYCNVWLDTSLSYKFILADSADNPIYTVDNIIGLVTNNAIPTTALQDLCVTTAKIADDSVTSAKLSDSASVDADRAVSTNHIKDAVITQAKMALSSTSAVDVKNFGFTASVGSNALTLTLKSAAGATPSATDPVSISFRDSTATVGTPVKRTATAATSIVVPSGATLGHVAAVDHYVWLYAIDNAGTIELAVSGVTPFEDNSIQSTTVIDTSSDSGTVMYSTTARSNVPVRLIGRILIQEATAGTWATAPTQLVLNPVPKKNETDWTTFTISTASTQGFGTVSVATGWVRRNGPNKEYTGIFTSTTPTGVEARINLDGSTSADSTRLTGSTNLCGYATISNSLAAAHTVLIESSKTYFTIGTQSATNGGSVKRLGNEVITTGNIFHFYASVPIQGYSTFGP